MVECEVPVLAATINYVPVLLSRVPAIHCLIARDYLTSFTTNVLYPHATLATVGDCGYKFFKFLFSYNDYQRSFCQTELL